MKKAIRKSIKFKLISMTLYFTFFIALFIVSICYTSFHNLLNSSLIESTTSHLQLIANDISSSVQPAIDLANWCSHKNVIINYLSSPDAAHTALTTSAWQQLKEEYTSPQSSNYISRVVIGNYRKNYLHVSRIASFNAFNMVDTITHLPYFDQLYNSRELTWVGPTNNPFSDQKDELMLPIITPIYSKYNLQKVGWCYISLSTKALTHELSKDNFPDDSHLLLTINNETYDLLDPSLSKVAPSELLSCDKKGTTYVSQVQTADHITQTYITTPCQIKGWYLSQNISSAEFKAQKRIYIMLIFIICLVVVTLGITLTFILDYLIIKPINNVLHKINQIAVGDFSYDATIESEDELGQIGKHINLLSKSVTELMTNRIRIENEKKNLEYQILQSQINPHFLYNTLNSIKWMATLQKTTGIPEMTTALARLLRAVSKDTKQIITLKEELDLLNNYFVIQQYRYGGTITLNYQIQSEDLYSYLIPKFTLQPILENAIFHGIEPKGDAGIITIAINLNTSHELIITVTDNGIGMTPQQIDHLLHHTDDNPSEFFKKIGIYNVHQRILYEFGPPYGLTIASVLNEYTTVTITLPATTKTTERSCQNE